MSPSWHDTPQSKKIVDACQKLIAGELGVVEASRTISGLSFNLWPAHGDKWIHDDFRVFILVDAASRHLPVGAIRSRWSPEALRVKDEELATIETRFREEAVSTARRLVQNHVS